MSTQPLEAAIASTREVLAAVTPDQMQNATPCESWDVAALINHVIGAQSFFAGGLEGKPPSTDNPDYAAGDYMAAYDEATATCVAGFGAEGAMQKVVKLPFGDMPGGAFMGLAVNDTFVHGWDLAKATGQSTDLAPELASGILTQAQASIQDSFRGPEGAPFGQQADCPDGACTADQLAAFLGRTV